MTENARNSIRAMSRNELDRLYSRLYHRIPLDCFGADWRTLRITRPALAESMAFIQHCMRSPQSE